MTDNTWGGRRDGSGRKRLNPRAALGPPIPIRATATEKERWKKAARKAEKSFGQWARDTLSEAAKEE